jgi:hypothetical protein
LTFLSAIAFPRIRIRVAIQLARFALDRSRPRDKKGAPPLEAEQILVESSFRFREMRRRSARAKSICACNIIVIFLSERAVEIQNKRVEAANSAS